jgi:hypothetical protein
MQYLDDKRNWISEWAKIKKSIQENFVKKLKSDDNKKIKKSLGLKIDSNLNIRNHNKKIVPCLYSVLIVFWNGCNI